MQKLLSIVSGLWLVMVSCAGFEEIKQTDDFGRTLKKAYYDGSSLHHLVEYKYRESDPNPYLAIYKKDIDSDLRPYREEHFFYTENRINQVVYYSYTKNEKSLRGRTLYHYNMNMLSMVKYYTYYHAIGKYILTGLDQYEYKNNYLNIRRIISYSYNPDTHKSIQTGQYIVRYNEGSLVNMKTAVLDQKTNKIIENKLENKKDIKKKLDSKTYTFLKKARGNQ